MALSDLLAGNYDDPAEIAARNLDWYAILEGIDKRQLLMLHDVLKGEAMGLRLRKQGLSYESIKKLRRDLAAKLRAGLGENIIADLGRVPQWQANLTAESEKVACKVERRSIQ